MAFMRSLILFAFAVEILCIRVKHRHRGLENAKTSQSTTAELDDARRDLTLASTSKYSGVEDIYKTDTPSSKMTPEVADRLAFRRHHCPQLSSLKQLLDCEDPKMPSGGASGALTVFSCDMLYVIKELLPEEVAVTKRLYKAREVEKYPADSLLIPACYWVPVGLDSSNKTGNQWLIMPNLVMHRVGHEVIQQKKQRGFERVDSIHGKLLGVFDLKGKGATPRRLSWYQSLFGGDEYEFETNFENLLLRDSFSLDKRFMLARDLDEIVANDLTDYSLLVVASEPRAKSFPKVRIETKDSAVTVSSSPSSRLMGILPKSTLLEVVNSEVVHVKNEESFSNIGSVLRVLVPFAGIWAPCETLAQGKKRQVLPCGSTGGFGWITVEANKVVPVHETASITDEEHLRRHFSRFLSCTDAVVCNDLDALTCWEDIHKNRCPCACTLVMEMAQRPSVFKRMDILDMLHQHYSRAPWYPRMIFSSSPQALTSKLEVREESVFLSDAHDVMKWGFPLCTRVNLETHKALNFGGMAQGAQWPIEVDGLVNNGRKRVCVAMSIIDTTKTGADLGVSASVTWLLFGTTHSNAKGYADWFRDGIFGGLLPVYQGAGSEASGSGIWSSSVA